MEYSHYSKHKYVSSERIFLASSCAVILSRFMSKLKLLSSFHKDMIFFKNLFYSEKYLKNKNDFIFVKQAKKNNNKNKTKF